MFLFRKKKPAKAAAGPTNTSAPRTPVVSGLTGGAFDQKLNGSQCSSLPRPAQLSPTSNLASTTFSLSPVSPSTTPVSPTASQFLVFEIPRKAPASYLRHQRVSSGASASIPDTNLPECSNLLHMRQRAINLALPPELLPVVNLINAQKLRQYITGTLTVLGEDRVSWLSSEVTLTGIDLTIRPLDSEAIRYVNIQDCSVFPQPVTGHAGAPYELVILEDFAGHLFALRFADTIELFCWLAAIHLAKFETTSLQEAFTAVLLSLKGPELWDINTLLSHKHRFIREEWCSLRLPQVSNKWIKVFVTIRPGDNKKKGRLEAYALKKTTKNNLVLYVDSIDSVYNVYPEDYRMIEYNLIMKLECHLCINKNFEYLVANASDVPGSPQLKTPEFFQMRKSESGASLSSDGPPNVMGPNLPGFPRSNSGTSSSSFFLSNLSAKSDEGLVVGSSKAAGMFKKLTDTNFVETDYFYLMPHTHPSVSVLEIMLRNFIHIINAFELYGRPEHLSSNKRDPVSMLYGLPELPHHRYMDLQDAFEVVVANFELSCLQNWSLCEWRAALKEYLSFKQRDSGYKGSGNIYDLFNSIELVPGGLYSIKALKTRVPGQVPLAHSLGIHEALNYAELKNLEAAPAARNLSGVPAFSSAFDYTVSVFSQLVLQSAE